MNRDIAILRDVVTKVTQILSGMGIRVTQQGAQAFVATDPKTLKPIRVNIPMIPDSASEDFILAIQGFIDHEVGHVLDTDWEVVAEAAKKGPTWDGLQNIVEDPFVERCMKRRFPGSAHNLDRLYGFFIEKLTKPALQKVAGDPMKEFQVLLVPVVRAWAGQKRFADFLADNGYWDHPIVKAFTDRVSDALRDRCATAKTSRECWEVAQEFHDIVYPPAPPVPQTPPPPPPQQNEEQPGDGEACEDGQPSKSKSQDDDKSDEKQDGQGSNQNKPEDDEDQGSGGEESDEKDEDEAAENDDGGSDSEGDEADESDGGAAGDEDSEEADGSEDDGEDDASADPSEDDAESDEGSDDEDDAGDEAGDEEEESSGSGEDDAGDDDDSEPSDGVGDDDAEDDDGDEGAGQGDAADEDEGEADGDVGVNQAGEGEDEQGGESVDQTEDRTLSPKPSPFAAGEVEIQTFAGQVLLHITDEASRETRDADYRVFTRDWDRIEKVKLPEPKTYRGQTSGGYQDQWLINLDDRTRGMVGKMQKDIERLVAARSQVIRVPGYRSGRLHAANLHRLSTGDDRIFRRTQENNSKDTAVYLKIDNSGSMGGTKMTTAMTAGYALSQTLERVGVAHMVSGFTTAGFEGRDGADQFRTVEAEERRLGVRFSRSEPMVIHVYKDFGERLTPEVKKRFATGAQNQVDMGANIDGESVWFAVEQLMKRREARKVLFVLSDGMPATYTHYPQEIYAHLHKVVADAKKVGVEIVGIGIQSPAVKTFYPRHVVLNNVEELPGLVMGELKNVIAA